MFHIIQIKQMSKSQSLPMIVQKVSGKYLKLFPSGILWRMVPQSSNNSEVRGESQLCWYEYNVSYNKDQSKASPHTNTNSLFQFLFQDDYQPDIIKLPSGEVFKQKNNRKYNSQIIISKNEYQNSHNEMNQLGIDLKQVSISPNVFATLQPGMWLSQNVICAYLELYENWLDCLYEKEKKDYYLITPNQFQDTFESENPQQEFNHQTREFKKIIMSQEKKIKNGDKGERPIDREKRIIKLLNHERSHFFVIEKDGDVLKFYDSLSQRRDILYKKFKNIFDANAFFCSKYEQVEIPQQQNSYDCGVYATYVCTWLMAKKLRKKQPKLEFNQQTMNRFRQHIKNVLTKNFSSLDVFAVK